MTTSPARVAGRRRPRRRLAAWTAAAAVAGTVAAGAHPAAAAIADSCLHATDRQSRTPTPSMERLSPDRAWWLSRGEGVTIAVLGSGVDARHPQLQEAVRPGLDLLDGGTADDDCDGTGTFVAGLAAARTDLRTSVAGIAPTARILPVRIHEHTDSGAEPPDPDLMAQGIDYAVDQGARVIVVYRSTDHDTEALRRAVERASRHQVVIVAGGLEGATDDETHAYPCHYPAVLAVAGLDDADTPVAGSCPVGDVDVSAPALGLVSLGAGGAGQLVHLTADDAGLASGWVAGSAALLLSRWPELSSVEVRDRLRDTADRPSSGLSPDVVGGGVVNPYAALTLLPRQLATPEATPEPTVSVPRPTKPRRDLAPVLAAGVLLGLGGVLGLAALAVRRASKRGWQPGGR